MITIIGKVVDLKMKDTVVVEVERFHSHSLYKKKVRTTKRYHVGNAESFMEVGKGDMVRFIQTRPISKTKKWKIVEVVRKNKKQ